MIEVGETFLAAVAPRFSGVKAERQKAMIGAIGPILAGTLAASAIDTRLRIAHFAAQVAHESAGFRATEEFASGRAYEGRIDLGNLRAGDGPRFKGRGLIQLTGRANYRRLGERLALPLEDQPALAAVPAIALRIACEYWTERALNRPADADDLETITRRVNGGLNGLEDRGFYLDRAKAALAAISDADRTDVMSSIARKGARGNAVAALQARLRERGYRLTPDGIFGAQTERAVIDFQARAKIEADGIAGPKTWAALSG